MSKEHDGTKLNIEEAISVSPNQGINATLMDRKAEIK